jgi:hypothetical protein
VTTWAGCFERLTQKDTGQDSEPQQVRRKADAGVLQVLPFPGQARHQQTVKQYAERGGTATRGVFVFESVFFFALYIATCLPLAEVQAFFFSLSAAL